MPGKVVFNGGYIARVFLFVKRWVLGAENCYRYFCRFYLFGRYCMAIWMRVSEDPYRRLFFIIEVA